ncbi:MAG: histidine kinase [Akkermansiaceae bacterium]
MRCVSLILAALLPAVAVAKDEPHAALSLSQLEQRLEEINSKLDDLASFSLRGGVGRVGFRSKAYSQPDQLEWVKVDWGREVEIDQIVLVPTIWRDTKTGFRQDGFPLEFRILVGTTPDDPGTEIASFTAKDRLLPRIAPLIIPCPGVKASWVKVEATLLSPRAWDQLHDLELAEILVFSGRENVALRQATQASSHREEEGVRPKENLVDGSLPYLMDAAHGEQSIAFVSRFGAAERPSLTFDLGTARPINRIHLHAVDTSDTVPQSTPSDFGIPRGFVIEGANRSDFTDAVRLLEFHAESPFDVDPIIMLHFPEAVCRFVRLSVTEPYILMNLTPEKQLLGFAEIEIFAAGVNVVLGMTPSTTFDHPVPGRSYPGRSLSALTDGANFYGAILPIRDWLEELALRHDLEAERPFVRAELSQRYARQKIRLVWMGWLATALAAGIVLTILIDRILRMRHVARIRERFAADLHDELGADIHSIRILGELALASKDIPERLNQVLQSSQEIAQRASNSVRHCMNIHEANGLYGSLKQDMHWAAERIMAQLEYDITVEGEDFLQRLKPRTKTDLFLFFKECLINISRHADATRFSTHLTANHNEICMTISDNGRGLSDLDGKGVPPSLQRRARLLGAHIVTRISETGETLITLKLKTRKLGFRK